MLSQPFCLFSSPKCPYSDCFTQEPGTLTASSPPPGSRAARRPLHGGKPSPSSCQIRRRLEKLCHFRAAPRLQTHFSSSLFFILFFTKNERSGPWPRCRGGGRGWGRRSALQRLLDRPKLLKVVISHAQRDPFPSKFAPIWCPGLPSAWAKDARCRLSSNAGKNQGARGVPGSLFPRDGAVWLCAGLARAAEVPRDLPHPPGGQPCPSSG